MKHEHKEHKHKTKHCDKCDVVYCEIISCDKEWRYDSSTITFTTPDDGTGTYTGILPWGTSTCEDTAVIMAHDCTVCHGN